MRHLPQHHERSRSMKVCSSLWSQATAADGQGANFASWTMHRLVHQVITDCVLFLLLFVPVIAQDKWSFWQCNLKETWFSHQERRSPGERVSGTMLGEALRAVLLTCHSAHGEGLLLTALWPCRDWDLPGDGGNRCKVMLFTASTAASTWPLWDERATRRHTAKSTHKHSRHTGKVWTELMI